MPGKVRSEKRAGRTVFQKRTGKASKVGVTRLLVSQEGFLLGDDNAEHKTQKSLGVLVRVGTKSNT